MALRLKSTTEGGAIRVYVDLNEAVSPFVAVAFELHADAGLNGTAHVWAGWKRPNGVIDEGDRIVVLTGSAVQERQAFPGPFQHPITEYRWYISWDPI